MPLQCGPIFSSSMLLSSKINSDQRGSAALVASMLVSAQPADLVKEAQQGDVKAQYNLGVMLANGKGVAQNQGEAVKWFRKAAEQGDADAQYNLGAMLANGEGVAQNQGEAVKWFRKAAEQ
ncbi:unnamed protein product, partial [Allacma fusca]